MDWVSYGDRFLPSRKESWKTWYWWRVIHNMRNRWERDQYEDADEDGTKKTTGSSPEKLKGTAAELAIGDSQLSKTGRKRQLPKLKSKKKP